MTAFHNTHENEPNLTELSIIVSLKKHIVVNNSSYSHNVVLRRYAWLLFKMGALSSRVSIFCDSRDLRSLICVFVFNFPPVRMDLRNYLTRAFCEVMLISYCGCTTYSEILASNFGFL